MKMEKSVWTRGEYVKAMAYDTPVPGYNTFNTNCLRLWSALPSFERRNKEYHCQTDDDYINLVKTRQRAERITSVLFYKDPAMSKVMQEDIIK
jgi:starch phosphorylase